MNPYYDHAGVTLYHGDCVDVLAQVDVATGPDPDEPAL